MTTPETYEEWESRLKRTCAEARGSNFKIGDCIIEGELSYGERYSQALQETGLRYDTLAHIKYVASHVPFENRIPTLSFSHHRAVAAIPMESQRQWLEQAQAEGWSSGTLRQRVLLGLGREIESNTDCKICGSIYPPQDLRRVSVCQRCLHEETQS